MPLYEFKCQRCGVSFEVLQKIDGSPLKNCIKCGGKLEKVISPPTIQFKGDGWYVTDYALKKKPEKEEKQTKEKPKSEKVDSKKNKKKNHSPSTD